MACRSGVWGLGCGVRCGVGVWRVESEVRCGPCGM